MEVVIGSWFLDFRIGADTKDKDVECKWMRLHNSRWSIVFGI